MIKHNDEYISAYAHNNTLLVRNAQEVKAGQKIATMGSTGTDKVMLHFQIRYRATALDPLRFLPAQGSAPSC
ncbi:Murein hydrolase activator NlpD precursor [compost metagenome]|jgi:lipoprotein YgeR